MAQLQLQQPGALAPEPQKEAAMKARLYPIGVAALLLAVVVEGLGAGWKWG